MAPQESYQSYFLRIDPGRRKIDDPILEQLTRCIVSSVKERERRNYELSRRNAELQSALKWSESALQRRAASAQLISPCGSSFSTTAW